MSHDSWLMWVKSIQNEPNQFGWEKSPYKMYERNPHTGYKMYEREIPIQNVWERNPHSKCMRKIPIQNVWEIWAPCILYGRLTVTLADRRKCCRHKINLLGRSRACPKGVLRQLRPIRSAFLLRPVWVQDLNLPSLLSAAAAETCTRIPIYKSMRDQYPVRPSNQNRHGWSGMEVFLPGWSGKIL